MAEQTLILTQAQVAQIVAQAQVEYPNEACGVLGGTGERVLKVYPARNALHSSVRYRVQDQDALAALLDIEAQGWGVEPLAIYHSHPHGPKTPSPADVAEAYYPDSVYVILSHVLEERPVVRGYRIVEGRVWEVTIRVEAD